MQFTGGPRNHDTFYIMSYYLNWVKTSWTCSNVAGEPWPAEYDEEPQLGGEEGGHARD